MMMVSPDARAWTRDDDMAMMCARDCVFAHHAMAVARARSATMRDNARRPIWMDDRDRTTAWLLTRTR